VWWNDWGNWTSRADRIPASRRGASPASVGGTASDAGVDGSWVQDRCDFAAKRNPGRSRVRATQLSAERGALGR
jgi:hypothetical protein